MKRLKMLLLVFMIGIFAFTTNVFAETKNEVTLNFKGGTIQANGTLGSGGLRPYISLKSDAKILNGTGTSEKPYIIAT